MWRLRFFHFSLFLRFYFYFQNDKILGCSIYFHWKICMISDETIITLMENAFFLPFYISMPNLSHLLETIFSPNSPFVSKCVWESEKWSALERKSCGLVQRLFWGFHGTLECCSEEEPSESKVSTWGSLHQRRLTVKNRCWGRYGTISTLLE